MAFFNSLLYSFQTFLFSLVLFVHFIASAVTGNSGAPVVQNTPWFVDKTATSTTPASNIATVTATSTAPKLVQTHVPTQTQTAIKITTATTTSSASITLSPDNAKVSADGAAVEQLNSTARSSLVNILCTTVSGGMFNPISGSGVVIDSRGIILTNAHVAQYFLLKDYPFKNNITCVIRTGSPAYPQYTAEVMYLPKEWVDANASQLTETHPTGTGENDYAFLRITGGVSASVQVPTTFPVLPMTALPPEVGAPVLLTAYPAGLLSGQTIQTNLYSSSAVSTVKDIYSFDGQQHVDLISLAGTVVSQTGSSGGALVGIGSQKLLGIIATETSGTTTADRQLNAVTVGFISRSLAVHGFGSLTNFLSGDAVQIAADFNANIAPKEIAELSAALKKLSN